MQTSMHKKLPDSRSKDIWYTDLCHVKMSNALHTFFCVSGMTQCYYYTNSA